MTLKVKEKDKVDIRLEKNGDGSIDVKANGWFVFSFTKTGKIQRHTGIDQYSGFPFKVTRDGAARVTKN